jgi:hypothetical protein
MKRVYVAGAYSAPDVIGVLSNIRRGVKECAGMLKQGYAPFCPWLDWQFSMFETITLDEYRDYSMAWLEASDEVWVLPNSEHSKGTQAEIARATELGIPVVYLD